MIAVRAMIRLRDEFVAGPRFWKSAAVNWYEDGMGWNERVYEPWLVGPNYFSLQKGVIRWKPDYYTYPSWGVVNHSAVNVTYGDGAPTISLENTNDVAAWMLCEMLTTVFTVSNNQVMSGTCAPSAVLASLLDKRPAQGIKMALTIGWTGSFPGYGYDDVCEFIYELAPGIVPWIAFNPGFNGITCFCSAGTIEDCLAPNNGLGLNLPCQAVGIEEMWTQLLLTASYKEIADQCPEKLGLFYPGVFGETFYTIEALQGYVCLHAYT